METKSRYEVIAELEAQKRNLIREREGFDKVLLLKKRDLKDLERDLEDKKEELKEFEESMEASKQTITQLIESVDDSLKRFEGLQNKK
jgi:chromosome segregation ATPase